MNQATPITRSVGTRPSYLEHSTFVVWRLLDNGKAQREVVQGVTLALIEREIATASAFGKTIFVRETETLSGAQTLHVYRIRKGKPTGWDRDARRVYSYTADKLFAMEISAFEPVEPWRCVAGADRLGIDSRTITFAKEANRG